MTEDEWGIKRLWASVVVQALIDATQQPASRPAAHAKTQAHAWLTTEVGVTAENFEAVCLAAELEPSVVRRFYLKYEGPPLTVHSLARLRDGRPFKEVNNA